MPTTTKKTTTKKAPAKTVETKTVHGPKALLFNLKAEKVGEVALSKEIFGVKTDNDLIAKVIRAGLASRRVAHAKVKDRGQVSGTTKKMWAQKGTGRARHGSAKAGIFVGGGSAHGPQGNQDFTLTVTKKARKLALNSLLSKFAAGDLIVAVQDFDKLPAKTKEAWSFMENLEKSVPACGGSAKVGVITEKGADSVFKAFRNIPGFTVMAADSLNTLDLSRQNVLIFSKSAVESLK